MGIGVINMPIGENIKRLRTIHGLSQKEFARIAGVSDKAVSTWESGLKEPRMGAVQKIADHFGLKKSNLIEDNGLDISITHAQSPTPAPASDDLPALTQRDERQIAKDLEDMLHSLKGSAAMGELEDEEDMELLKASLLQAMTLSKRIAKKKFTPKKYRK